MSEAVAAAVCFAWLLWHAALRITFCAARKTSVCKGNALKANCLQSYDFKYSQVL